MFKQPPAILAVANTACKLRGTVPLKPGFGLPQ